MMDLKEPEQLFVDFRFATMAAPESVLAQSSSTATVFRMTGAKYGSLLNHAMGVSQGVIDWVAPVDQIPQFSPAVEVVSGNGRWMTPGLVDCHTHLVFGGNRAEEWESRLSGDSYEDIARRGGGILSSVRSTRLASEESLTESAAIRLKRMLEEGVTTVEIKSGYGLDLENEIKMLEAARALEKIHEVSIETTLLAAHAIPPEFSGNADSYIDLVCHEIIPAAQEYCSAVDAFCETIAFSVPQTQRVFESAIEHGLAIKVHGEQLTRTGISSIAAKLGALSVDHLEYLSFEDCQVIGQTDTVATLLPGAFYCLNETQKPPVAALREHRVPMALATDCNPGSSPVTSLLLMANMGCNLFGMTAEEALQGVTVHAAKALGMESSTGRLQPGLFADFAVWDVHSPAEIVYGVGHNPCHKVYRRGRLVLEH